MSTIHPPICRIFLGAVVAVLGQLAPCSAQVRLQLVQPSPLAVSADVEKVPAALATGTAQLPPPAERTPLSLSDMQALALAQHPSLVQAAARIEGARGQWIQSGFYPNPTVGYSAEEVGTAGTAGLQGGFINQEIVRGGKLTLDRTIAQREIRQTQQQFAAQRYRVLNDVQVAFYDVLVAQQTIEITTQLLELSERGWRLATDLLNVAEGNRIDVLQARVEADTARIALEQARNRYAASWRQLSFAVGSPDLPMASLHGELEAGLPEIEWESTLARLLAESPEMLLAAAKVERAEASLRRARVEPIPNLFVQSSVQYAADSRDTVANLQLGVPLPVFNQNQGNIRRAAAELAEAQAAVSTTQLSLQNRLAAAFERYANARRQTEMYTQHILPNARTSLELVNTGYQQGQFNYLVVLTAQRTYFQAALAYLASLRELRTASIAIEGLLLIDGLQYN